MRHLVIPDKFSVLIATPCEWRINGNPSLGEDISACMAISVPSKSRAYFFRDLQMGTILCIASNNTFSLHDPAGYRSGIIQAQQMKFEVNGISVWHQDQRFSFTCQADITTGFCFGWLIDRRYSKSYRILDPGKTG